LDDFLFPTFGQVAVDAADAAEVGGEARAGELGDAVEDELAGFDSVEKSGEGAELEAERSDGGEVIGNAMQLGADDANVFGPLGYLDAHQRFDGRQETEVV